MGKSGKKCKSDRINALRKQYDAFMDEDKKRKDRNEFILGRLEKMRLCTVRDYMGNPQINKYCYVSHERPDHLKKIRFGDNPILRSRPIDVFPDMRKDEQRILQEISKKYILIPKLQSQNESSVINYNSSSVSNDADWRKKYHILEELKKIEKEGSSDVSRDELVHDNFNDDHEFKKLAPEKIKGQKFATNRDLICNTQQNNDQTVINELQENSNYKVESKSPFEHTKNIVLNAVITSNIENETTEAQSPICDSNRVCEESNSSENVDYNQVQDIQKNEMKETDNIVPQLTDEICENDKNEPVIQNQVAEPSGTETTTVSEKENSDQNLKNDDVVIKPVELNANQEPGASASESNSENIQQQQIVVNDNVIPSQIEEFETEQKEMFYSEDAGYNQNVDTMGYTQNENNTNEQYSYYNESQQEQPYFAEINEHEESMERYDPNYAQQYAENYEENVNAVQYENQQYGVDNYENQQEVSNVYYEQPDQQEITNLNYEQQPSNYEYEQSEQIPEQGHVDNISAYGTHASEHDNYETQQFNEVGEVDLTVPDQNVYENPQEYVQNTEQNVEQHLDQEEGYIETKNFVPIEPVQN